MNDPVQDLLVKLRSRGIGLVVDGGHLRYNPRSAMTPELLERLKQHKAELLKRLEPPPDMCEAVNQVKEVFGDVEVVDICPPGAPQYVPPPAPACDMRTSSRGTGPELQGPRYQTDGMEVYVGDCCQVLQRDVTANLIVADPPYNIGQDYSGFTDHWSTFDDYENWCREWMAVCARRLAPNGSLWVLVQPRAGAYLTVLAERRLGLELVQQVQWHYRFGQHTDQKFISSHTTWLWLCHRGRRPKFNPDAVLVASDRQTKYSDKRIEKSKRGGMRVPFDVWKFSRVQGNNKERRRMHPNQLPEMMVARIIRACSNPGDLVIDPFLGSGTTGVVAKALGRKFIGVDISETSAVSAWERITKIGVKQNVKHEVGYGKTGSLFEESEEE